MTQNKPETIWVGWPHGPRTGMTVNQPIPGVTQYTRSDLVQSQIDAAVVVDLICDGCGCREADLDVVREHSPETISCCPERKMRPITHADLDAAHKAALDECMNIARLAYTGDADGRDIADDIAALIRESE